MHKDLTFRSYELLVIFIFTFILSFSIAAENNPRRPKLLDDFGGHNRSIEAKTALAAQQGDKEAQYHFGVFQKNTGNLRGAEIWWRKAAEQGHKKATEGLAALYTDQNKFEEAKVWWLKSLEQGNTDATVGLAIMYEKQGNSEQANKWLEDGVKRGSKAAKYAQSLGGVEGLFAERRR